MQKVLWSIYGCVLILGLMFIAFPQPFFSEPQIAQGSEIPSERCEAVFSSACRDFDLLASLLSDTTYVSDSAYPVLLKVNDHQAAIDYLSQGFQIELAEVIANNYLAWDEDLNRLVVIPTDFIPILIPEDRPATSIIFINENSVILQRIYRDCYAVNDSYMYTINMRKAAHGWIIYDLSLQEITAGNEDDI